MVLDPIGQSINSGIVIGIGSSAGGLAALSRLLWGLPVYFPAAILVVLHRRLSRSDSLAPLLSYHTSLVVKSAEEGDVIVGGTVYVAPADKHLLTTPYGTLTFSKSPKENFVRPSINVLFESIAENYRHRAIGVILTGMGSDGAKGAQSIKQKGGRVLAQDEKTSQFFSMPNAVIATGCVDLVLPINSIDRALIAFTMVRGAANLFCSSFPLLPAVGSS